MKQLPIMLPEYDKIPDVGLYLEQVIIYLNNYLEPFIDSKVTSSMITNYIKHKIVRRINKKTYTRDQIAEFFFIIMAKSILSLDKIAILIKANEAPDFEAYYSRFRLQLINNEKTEDELLFRLTRAIIDKIYLEKGISSF